MFLQLSDARVPAEWRRGEWPEVSELLSQGFSPYWSDGQLSLVSRKSERLSILAGGGVQPLSAPVARPVFLQPKQRCEYFDAPSKVELHARLQSTCIDRSNCYRGRVHFSAQLQTLGTPRAPLIVAYATLTNVLSANRIAGHHEVIRPGAFRSVLAQRPYVRAMCGHHFDLTVASTSHGTLHLEEDELGLLAIVDPNHSDAGLDLVRAIRAGRITQMSFSLHTAPEHVQHHYYQDGLAIREIHRVELLDEISFVHSGVFAQTLCTIIGEPLRLEPSLSSDERLDYFMAMESRP